MHLAGVTTTLLGVGIGATAPILGPLVAVLGGGMALLGIALFHEAPESSMKARCPTCGAEIVEIEPTTDVVHCPTCGDYARLTNGMLLAMHDDFVAARPSFAIPVRGDAPLVLPSICAECGGADVSHHVRLEVHVADIPLATPSAYRVVDVPHCARHASGALAELGALRVRSRALWLAIQPP